MHQVGEKQKEKEWAVKEKLTPKLRSVDLENRMKKNICMLPKMHLSKH